MRRSVHWHEPVLGVDDRLRPPRVVVVGGEDDRAVALRVAAFAESKRATPAQIALAWVLAQHEWIVPIPGTTKLYRLEENLGAVNVELTQEDLRQLDQLTSQIQIQGNRYSEAAQKMVNR